MLAAAPHHRIARGQAGGPSRIAVQCQGHRFGQVVPCSLSDGLRKAKLHFSHLRLAAQALNIPTIGPARTEILQELLKDSDDRS